MVRLRDVDGLFLHVYLSVYRLLPRDLQLSQRGVIRNSDTARVIREAYRTYTESGQNLEDYFDIQIINFQASHHNRPYTTSCGDVTRPPVIVYSVRNEARSTVHYNHGKSPYDLKLNQPIKMSLKHIFTVFGILTTFRSSGKIKSYEN